MACRGRDGTEVERVELAVTWGYCVWRRRGGGGVGEGMGEKGVGLGWGVGVEGSRFATGSKD